MYETNPEPLSLSPQFFHKRSHNFLKQFFELMNVCLPRQVKLTWSPPALPLLLPKLALQPPPLTILPRTKRNKGYVLFFFFKFIYVMNHTKLFFFLTTELLTFEETHDLCSPFVSFFLFYWDKSQLLTRFLVQSIGREEAQPRIMTMIYSNQIMDQLILVFIYNFCLVQAHIYGFFF